MDPNSPDNNGTNGNGDADAHDASNISFYSCEHNRYQPVIARRQHSVAIQEPCASFIRQTRPERRQHSVAIQEPCPSFIRQTRPEQTSKSEVESSMRLPMKPRPRRNGLPVSQRILMLLPLSVRRRVRKLQLQLPQTSLSKILTPS